ncbi:Complement component 1 Q subcomponent-binding protein, mitochondrial, partial [Galemys pyrenaicus]
WELEISGIESKLVRKVAGENPLPTFHNSIPGTLHKVEEQKPELTAIPNAEVEVQKMMAKRPLCSTVTIQRLGLDKNRGGHFLHQGHERSELTAADELVELSTALEHQDYISFLKNLEGSVENQQRRQ